MNTSVNELTEASVQSLEFKGDALVVYLSDARTLSVPLAWYPRLYHGKPHERENYRLIAEGKGIHWPDLEEDISVAGMLMGRPSAESQASLSKWLDARAGQDEP